MSLCNEDYYDTSHPKLGVALIFNHLKFKDGLDERHGSIKDTEKMSQALAGLGFDVRVFKDKTVENIKNELEKGKK